ncbi:hypothetical protein JCM11641_002708 [Rhodosporidiobolus odoratus]
MQKLFSSPGHLMSRSPSSSAALDSPSSHPGSAALPPDAPSPILPTFPPSPPRPTAVFPRVASPPSSPPPRPPAANRPSPHSSPQSRRCRPVSAASSPPASPTGSFKQSWTSSSSSREEEEFTVWIMDLAKGLAAAVAAAEVDQIQGTPLPSPPTSEKVHEYVSEGNQDEKGGLGAVLVWRRKRSRRRRRVRMLAGARA